MKIEIPKFVVVLALPILFLKMLPAANAASQYMDYFTASPIVGSLSSNCWGAATVGPRDPKNGLEDETMKQWNYWDGQIIKAPDGKYHLFCSRWNQAGGHGAWYGSVAVHATSLLADVDVSGLQHNKFGGFLALRPGLMAAGGGEARFERFVYKKL